MSYMHDLLEELRPHVADDETLERIRVELVRSFKNGIMRGREGSAGDQRRLPKAQRRSR